MAVGAVSDETFQQEVLKSDLPVLVDFWAPWCQPCKRLAPVLEDIVDDYQGKVKISKMDVEQNPSTCKQYGIRGIPALLLYKDGKVLATKIGGDLSKSQLSAFLDSNI